MPIAYFTRRYHISASHRLHAPSLTDQQNRDTYGKCNNPFGHGHNYLIEVTVVGPIDPNTGFVVDMTALDALAERELLDRFDATNLNSDPVFAADFVPSTENLSVEVERCFRESVPALDPSGHLRLHSIRIEETGRNSFDLSAQPAHPPASISV